MDAMQILVIILSIFLALFLVLAIILTFQLIRVTRQIRMIATTTQSAVDKVSNLAASAGKLISPALIAKFFSEHIMKSKKSSKKEDN